MERATTAMPIQLVSPCYLTKNLAIKTFQSSRLSQTNLNLPGVVTFGVY